MDVVGERSATAPMASRLEWSGRAECSSAGSGYQLFGWGIICGLNLELLHAGHPSRIGIMRGVPLACSGHPQGIPRSPAFWGVLEHSDTSHPAHRDGPRRLACCERLPGVITRVARLLTEQCSMPVRRAPRKSGLLLGRLGGAWSRDLRRESNADTADRFAG